MSYASKYPEHSRKSCSDTDPAYNADPEGHGCWRCNALMFDRLAQLEASEAQRADNLPKELKPRKGRYTKDFADGFNRCRREVLAYLAAPQKKEG